MKDGDKLIQLIKNRNQTNLLLNSTEYEPVWFYWIEYLKVGQN